MFIIDFARKVIDINGEIGIKIESVDTSEMIRPYTNYGKDLLVDLNLKDSTGEYLHICGYNDWGYLALEILKPLLKEGLQIYNSIRNEIEKSDRDLIEVIVGKNEYRLLDILHTARDTEYGIKVIKGIPIKRGNFNDGIKFLKFTPLNF